MPTSAIPLILGVGGIGISRSGVALGVGVGVDSELADGVGETVEIRFFVMQSL